MSSDVLQVAILVPKSRPRKLGLSFGHISSVSTLSCASAASFDSPPRSTFRKPFAVPIIKVSSSTSSDFLFLEPCNSSKDVHTSLLPALAESANFASNNKDGEASLNGDDQDHVLLDTILASAAELPKGMVAEGREIPLGVTAETLRRNSMSDECISKSRYKIIDELEALAYIVQTLETPIANTETPSAAVTSDDLVEKLATQQYEEMRPVFGLGIRFPGADKEGGEICDEKRCTNLRKTRSALEPSSSLRSRFHHAFDSLQKPFVKREAGFSPKHPKSPPPSPTNWASPSSNAGQFLTTLPGPCQKSLLLQHVVPDIQIKSVPSTPKGSLFAMSGNFIRRSLDVMTPHPRLSSVHSSLPVSSRNVSLSFSPANTSSGLSGTVKFLSLRDFGRRR